MSKKIILLQVSATALLKSNHVLSILNQQTKNKFMEQKNPTNAQLQRRLQNAVVFVPKVKDTTSIYFSDKGLRLTVTEPDDFRGYAVIETNYHRHVFDELNPNVGKGTYNPIDEKWVELPFSRPWLYTKRIIEIANENDCKTENGYSFAKLLEVLKAKEDQTEYNIAVYTEWWIFNCFQPLFSISESDIGAFLVYEAYLHNIARNAVILEEKKEDITDKQFLDKVFKNIQEFTGHNEPRIIFTKKTDEELMQEVISAIQEQENEQAMEAQMDGNK